MLPPNITPEKCYAKAISAINDGKFERAVKLLQLASLKAPEDKEIQEPLRIAQAHLQEQASSTKLLMEAQQLIQSGDTDAAKKLLQLAHAQNPNDGAVRAEVERLRAVIEAPRIKAQKKQEAIDNLTEKAANEEPRLERVTTPVRPGLVYAIRICVLLVLLGLNVGYYISFYTNKRIDPGPFAELLPVTNAELTRGQRELLLTLVRSEWNTLLTANPVVLSEVKTLAQDTGFSEVYLFDDKRNLLASISQDTVYLPRQ